MGLRHHRYFVITPFQRFENFHRLHAHLAMLGVVWVPVFDEEWSGRMRFPEPWIQPMCCPGKVKDWFMGYYKINWALDRIEHTPENRYCFLNDDDFFGPNFFDHLDEYEASSLIVCDLHRGHHMVGKHDCTRLVASPENMKIGSVASEQLIFNADLAATFRFGGAFESDGALAEEMRDKLYVQYNSLCEVWFNYLEPGRWDS